MANPLSLLLCSDVLAATADDFEGDWVYNQKGINAGRDLENSILLTCAPLSSFCLRRSTAAGTPFVAQKLCELFNILELWLCTWFWPFGTGAGNVGGGPGRGFAPERIFL